MTASFPARLPVVLAPMAGGPSTPALAAAVSNAGGLGFLAGALLTPEQLDERLTELESLTSAPYGINLFLPSAHIAVTDEMEAYRQSLTALAAELGVEPGPATPGADDIDDVVDVVCAHRPAAVSVTFGRPGTELTRRVHDIGALMVGTVTSVAEAQMAVEDGADMLVVQGSEAGGHRGVFTDDTASMRGGPAMSLASLLVAVGLSVEVPLIAAGGIMDGSAVVSALGLGAVAAQMGTAFLCSDEAGTTDVHRAALLDRRYRRTVVTRAFSGRPARGLENEFAQTHTGTAPAGYPDVNAITGPIRTAATAAGRADVPNLWAGTGWRAVTAAPAAEIVARVVAEMESA
ncbi:MULTISPECIES: NAD(P)H-dependent flavin oxidoreductase [unclassified Rhodococcus (in: high G+C Gram-positive bacteria)]|uniref:NAD(P)H-dependent flavin oxidoreductase n=1 Tax=unclassified Rhodococcus (in: high G+C Gram-positive bacteria) TaxID=192944 RepID=UPI001F312A39|nr:MULTISPECIES: nitronate monooxygenase [unclassified Rhodococcus (in: high G+C Gram-positive bacteria)]